MNLPGSILCFFFFLVPPGIGAGTNQPAGLEGMVQIPAGSYAPLFQSDQPRIPVDSFWLDVLPVTQAQFLQFVQANPRWRRSQAKRIFAEEEYLKNWPSDLSLPVGSDPHAPVTFVSWFAARAYAQWMHKRLPTTDEWEYAAAASTTRPDGENDPLFRRQVRTWYTSPSLNQLPAVGSNPPNLYRVHDLHGLVWEWVADFNNVLVSGDNRGLNSLDRQLFCGGAAQGAKDPDNFPAFMRYGFRSSLKASYTVHNLGFRCARNLSD